MQDLLAPSAFTITRITDKELLLKDKYFMLTTNIFRLIKLSFKSYIKKQKAIHEITKRLFVDSIKHNGAGSIVEKKQHYENKEKWIPLPPKITSQLFLARKE